MIVEIDLSKLNELDISLSQLTFLKLVINNQIKSIKSFATSFITMDEVNELIEKGYLTEDSTIDKPSVTQHFTDTYSGEFDKDLFQVFFELFPTSVVRQDGLKDYLRINLNRCKKLYKQIVGNSRTKHDHIVRCLLYEIENKRKTSKMGYFKRMPNWLSSEQWEEAEEMMKDKALPISVTYGTDME